MWFLDELKQRNEVLYFTTMICFVLGIVCLLLTRVAPIQVLGTSAWYKPFKFFMSTALFTGAMGWYLFYLGESRAVAIYSWGLVVLFAIEDVYIFLQAARGTTSHFNISSPFHAIMWPVMGAAAVAISVWTLIVSFPFFTRTFPELPVAYLWGIRFGLLIFVVFSLEGIAMGARMAHTVGAADGGNGLPIVNWSSNNGDLRVAHFFGMHALQILPLLGFFLIPNVYALGAVSLVYLAGCVFVFVQAISGKPFMPG